MNVEWEHFLKARSGDESAWRVLLAQHQTRLTALAIFITGSAAAADDVVQETFVRALGARLKDCSGTVRGFLGTIAYRLAIKESQRGRREIALDNTELTDSTRSPLDGVLKDERDRIVTEAIATLDDDHRDVLVLRFYGDYSYDEIASTLNVPVGTVKSRMFYAVKACRDYLRLKGVLE